VELLVRAHTPLGKQESGNFALDYAEKALKYFCNQFKCGLPLQKLDLVGCPLAGLGMENWGLITFRTDFFLVDDSTAFERVQRITRYVLSSMKVFNRAQKTNIYSLPSALLLQLDLP
jgi:aminopeptidase N